MTKKSKTAKLLHLEKFLKEDLWKYTLVLFVVFGTALIFSKWIEALCFCISHYLLRPKFDRQYHSNFMWACLSITCFIAFWGIILTLPLSLSLLASIPVALFVCWIGNVIAYNNELKYKIKKYQTKNIQEMTNDEFVKFCQHKGLQDYEIKIAEMSLRQGLKGKEFYEAIGYCERQAKTLRKRVVQMLGSEL